MHKAISNPVKPRRLTHSQLGGGRQRRKRRSLGIALGAVAVLLGLAWVDGGEEPLRTIVEPVENRRAETAS